MIPFNKPYLTGKEMHYMYKAVYSGKLSGNGAFTQKCQKYFETQYKFKKCLLTSSCTDALEMAAILCDLKPNDEVIIPSYTFVSTANAFVLRGAKIVFADSHDDHPGINEESIERLITDRTKVIVPVHYAGVACNMDAIMKIAQQYNLIVIEDAAQAVDSFYSSENNGKKALGSIGHMAAFSFHETKNIISGEGGMLVVNDDRFLDRAEIIWEKGTNRSAFFRGECDKYGWIDVGSSFLPSELTAAFLWAQLEYLEEIQKKRKYIWDKYYCGLREWAGRNDVRLPDIPHYATNNAHLFYIIFKDSHTRQMVIDKLYENEIISVFHYISLHSSPFYIHQHDSRILGNSDIYTNGLLRLPMYYELDDMQINSIIETIIENRLK